MSISRPFAALPHRTTEGEHVFPLLRHRISEFSPPPPLRAAAAHPESLFAPWEVFVFGTFSLTGDETVLTSITNSWQAASGTARLEKQRRNKRKKYWNEGKETTRHDIAATTVKGRATGTHTQTQCSNQGMCVVHARARGGRGETNEYKSKSLVRAAARAATETGDGRSMHVHKNN